MITTGSIWLWKNGIITYSGNMIVESKKL